jgi:hypothetical protein
MSEAKPTTDLAELLKKASDGISEPPPAGTIFTPEDTEKAFSYLHSRPFSRCE